MSWNLSVRHQDSNLEMKCHECSFSCEQFSTAQKFTNQSICVNSFNLSRFNHQTLKLWTFSEVTTPRTRSLSCSRPPSTTSSRTSSLPRGSLLPSLTIYSFISLDQVQQSLTLKSRQEEHHLRQGRQSSLKERCTSQPIIFILSNQRFL